MAYLDSIGGSTATNGTFSEYGIYGPVGDFYLFNWNNANALCATYNTNSIGGRTNWRLATRDELKVELYDVFRNMFGARGWPSRIVYWSATPHSNGSGYYFVLLFFGSVSSGNPSLLNYASCVSEP
ncbi:MAG: DUF1566 domain-containing protein [Vibrio toranzoniae]|uniref:Lcl C-terminal domain-containing protein n=1 Tax=Vibrio toranzoniae TaxID=1194427 RepID=UPI003F978C86